MRQRRQILQVSTFPFLAVLLCAMGSLILLLLVMDRRAKAVGRARAMQAVARMNAEEERAAALRAAELDRRRLALHQELEQNDQDLLAQVRKVQDEMERTAQRLKSELAQTGQLQDSVQSETERLARDQAERQLRQAEASATTAKTQASQAELARLTAELLKLERTLADLKLLRQREHQKYSVVAYRGKRGDKRRPIYVECDEAGVIFHPDREVLQGLSMSASAVRAAVEKRIAGRRPAGAVASARDEIPYLLMLIRPSGVTTYYRTLAALEGLKVDFGYEFIEPDWVLDFPETDDAPASQPWLTAGASPGATVSRSDESKVRRKPRVGAGPNQTAGSSLGGQSSNEPEEGHGAGPATGSATAGQGAYASGAGGQAEGSGARGQGAAVSIQELTPDRSPQSSLSFGPALPSRGGEVGGRSVAVAPGEARTGMALNRSPAGANLGRPTAQQSDNLNDLPGVNIGSGAATPEIDVPGGVPRILPRTTVQTSPNLPAGQPGQATAPDGPTLAAPWNPPGTSANGSGGRGVAGASANAAAESAGAPTVRPFLPEAPGTSKPAPPSPAGRMYSNRDWLILIECNADGVAVSPGSKRLSLAELSSSGNAASPLKAAIEQMIARRQALVRTGEPTYRPMIRFLVRPDGLRSYYLAYPALESLQVPMTRENVRPEEAKK
jgi:hypothetical protein